MLEEHERILVAIEGTTTSRPKPKCGPMSAWSGKPSTP